MEEAQRLLVRRAPWYQRCNGCNGVTARTVAQFHVEGQKDERGCVEEFEEDEHPMDAARPVDPFLVEELRRAARRA